jgi:hypothetical protein
MAEVKTRVTKGSVNQFLDSIADEKAGYSPTQNNTAT